MAIDTELSAVTYTVKIVFHRAYSLPIADLPSRSSDPYVSAEIRPTSPPSTPADSPSLANLSLSPSPSGGRRVSFSNPFSSAEPAFSLSPPPGRPRSGSFTGPGTGTSGGTTGLDGEPPLRFRTCTVQRTLNPEWGSEWIVAGVPGSAEIEARVYDEDSRKNDDLLGTAFIPLGPLTDHYSSEWVNYRLHRRGADRVALGLKAALGVFDPDSRGCASIAVSVRVLGRTQKNIGRMFTVNSHWWIHYSPLVGSLTGTKTPGQLGTATERDHYDFQANELQLHGPVPVALKHRFVPFKSFVAPTFESKGLRGSALHHIMRKQHRQIYHFDEWTKYGVLPDPVGPESRHPSVSAATPSTVSAFSDPFAAGAASNGAPTVAISEPVSPDSDPALEMSRRFLDMCYWGSGARIFTYVISRNGMMRFTETGPEFAIDLLSKHMMHADVDAYVAYSGEFFVRPYRPHTPERNGTLNSQNEEEDDLSSMLEPVPATRIDEAVHPALDRRRTSTVGTPPPAHGPRTVLGRKIVSGLERLGPAPGDAMPVITRTLTGPEHGSLDPSAYELVIDNESGTYRPAVEQLPLLRRFLAANLVGLHVTAMSGMDPQLKAWKDERRVRRRERLQGRVWGSAESDLESMESSGDEGEGEAPRGKHAKGFALLSDPKGAWQRRRSRGQEA